MGDTGGDARRILGHIEGGRVLDVATGRGAFVEFLADGLASYDEIVGLDVDAEHREAFEAAHADRSRVHFDSHDALDPTLSAGGFDTVAISASLHHFDDPIRILEAMRRLARPGGWIIVAEMYRDGQTEAQLTHVMLHDWCAGVDSLIGKVHHPTYRRAEIVRFVDGLALQDRRTHDLTELDDDPLDPDGRAALEGIIDRYVALAADDPDLVATGRLLRERVGTIGAHGATTLIEVGRLPGP
jgi:ubiquinone/menaquinone biosynthesis C-methylase UbiE